MKQTPDIIERCLAVVAGIAVLTEAEKAEADRRLRHEFGGSTEVYIRKHSPMLRDVIRARYDGTMETTRALAKELGVSETTVRRYGLRRTRLQPAAAPTPAPKLVGKGKGK